MAKRSRDELDVGGPVLVGAERADGRSKRVQKRPEAAVGAVGAVGRTKANAKPETVTGK